MASVTVNKNKAGEIISYRWRAISFIEPNGYKHFATKTAKPPTDPITGRPLSPRAALKQMKREAEEWEIIIQNENDHNKQHYGFSIFVDTEWIPRHVLNPDEDHTPSTKEFYKNMIRRPKDYFGNKDIREIKKNDIADFLYELSQVQQSNGKPLAAKTRKSIRQALFSVFNFARLRGYILVNPVADAPTVKRERKPVKYLSKNEISKFLQCLEQAPVKWRTMMYVLLFCGLRRGEATALTWGNVDLEAKCLNIIQNAYYVREPVDGEHIYVGRPKTPASIRVVPFTDIVRDQLLTLQENQKQLAIRKGINITNSQGKILSNVYLFNMSETGYFDFFKPLSPQSLTYWISDFSKSNNLPHIHPHKLRHTTGTMLAQCGVNARDGATFLGQSDTSVFLENYVGTDMRQMRNAAEVLTQHIVN